MPAEAEPRGDEGGGLSSEPPAARPSWLRRTRVAFGKSVWAPVALKLIGLALGMLALSGVGVASILSGVGGVQVPLAGMLGSDIHAAWLAGKPVASASSHPSGSSVPTSTGAAGAAGAAEAPGSGPAMPGSGRAAERPAAAPAAGPAGGGGNSGMTEDGKVILNQASVADLRHLPGVGQKRADAILALRTRLGRFKQVNDLLRIKGIGVRGLKKILPHVVLDPPKPSV